jgi:3-methyladenine DNA glycosylase/8-oxoguanine DNA glycosylase|tara:strand:+ start:1401 stop:1625 length:225 start_codon:yes stop_codon:yes gene_type:complete
MDQDFKSVVKETLATHTTKLENIEMQLKSIDSSLKYNMDRLNKLETDQAFMKGMGIFIGTGLTMFIGLVAYIGG